jgi:hypothetical protein
MKPAGCTKRGTRLSVGTPSLYAHARKLMKGSPMARKRRKSSAGKRKKKSKTVTRKKSRAQAKKRKLSRRQPRTLGDKVSNGYRTVIDTIKGTDQLRNKLEPPATSETE